ncbi:MAG: hypothetical protein IT328_26260 [Caldilineaceae bacterium]|nr:hypothetical protein [Caldilineaceae bacterium]
MVDEKSEGAQARYRVVPADLVETDPDNGGLFHWILASPMLGFLAWVWVDLFAHYSPISFYWFDVLLGLLIFALVVVLPLGVGAFFVVSALPRIFSHAGWDVQPLEPVSEAEMHTVRYRYQSRRRASNSWGRAWTRAAQGWVYLEIAAILVGAIVMIPIFFSVSEFGFGQP